MSPTDKPQSYEIRPDPVQLTHNTENPSNNASTGVDYEPHPEKSIKLEPERERIVRSICNLYSGSASEEDMKVYAEKAVYDDPWSYCDTRYKIAGQWYGIPKIFHTSKTLATEVVSSTTSVPTNPSLTPSSNTSTTADTKPSPTTANTVVFKLRQEYTPKGLHFSKPVNSLVSLTLDEEGKVKYHKDMWNQEDYSHEGLGKVMKTLNGDYLTKITQPPETL